MVLEEILGIIFMTIILLGLLILYACIVFMPVITALVLQVFFGVGFTQSEWLVIVLINVIYIFLLGLAKKLEE